MNKVIPTFKSVSVYLRATSIVGLLLVVGLPVASAPMNFLLRTRVLAAPGPEADTLTFIRDRHPELNLEVTVAHGDYVSALTSGDVDVASMDTHVGLRERLNATGAHLVAAGETLTKPLGFYAPAGGLAQLATGTGVIVPAERQAQARALLLLYSAGHVTFTRDTNTDLSLAEITGNPKKLELSALSRRERLAKMQTAAPVLIALDYDEASKVGLQPARDARLMEDAFSPFASVLIVRAEDAEAPWLKALQRAYHSKDVKTFLLRTYNDSVRRPW